MTISTQASRSALISGISVPDSNLANEITEIHPDTESTLLFNHSSRVYYFGAVRRVRGDAWRHGVADGRRAGSAEG
jgi:hypothetical protein